MKRADLEHLIRACGAITRDDEFIVIGSQSILGAVPEAPPALCRSMDLDVYPRHHPEQAIALDGAIGEGSIFHETFGYYAHGVGPETAILPDGWEDRLVPVRNDNTRGVTGWCLDPVDLAVSKLAAHREHDRAFVSHLLRYGLVDSGELRQRLASTRLPEARRRVMIAWIDRAPTS